MIEAKGYGEGVAPGHDAPRASEPSVSVAAYSVGHKDGRQGQREVGAGCGVRLDFSESCTNAFGLIVDHSECEQL